MEAALLAGEITSDSPAPKWLDTYALTYACGAFWLMVAIVLLGGQKSFAYDTGYDLTLVFPPVATALSVLLLDRYGPGKSLATRALLFAVVCGTLSALSTVLLTPLLVLMFRGGVTGDLSATGLVASIALTVVEAPVVAGLVGAVRRHRTGRAVVLLAGLLVAAIALVMALDPTGALATSLRLDQAEIVMIASAWWLPAYAVAAAFLRGTGLA